jgi:hypothetical protein
MQIANPSKALILLVALASITLLLAIGRITQDVAMPMLSAIVFYGIGNGVGAKQGQQSPKIFEKKTPE